MKLSEVLVKPILTEKANAQQEKLRRYAFKVNRKANKLEIKKAVESLFSVKVERVTTLNVLGKSKRTARGLGKRNDWKKAVISLQPGQDLDFSSSAE